MTGDTSLGVTDTLEQKCHLPGGLGRLPHMEASSCIGNSEAHFQSLAHKKLVEANTGVSKPTPRTMLLLP